MSYQFEEKEIAGVKSLQLICEGETALEILPNHGATLNQLKFKKDGAWISAIGGYAAYEEVPDFPGSRSAILFPFPNRLKKGNYKYRGVSYRFPTEEKHNGNAIHGFIRREQFALESFEAKPEGGTCRLAYYYNGSRQFYPFPFAVFVDFNYTGDQLKTSFEVENTGHTRMPVGLGWHPYFTLNDLPVDELKLKLPVMSKVILDEHGLPTGETEGFFDFENFEAIGSREFDNCYKLIMQDRSLIYSEKLEAGLSLEPSKEFLFLQVYIPQTRDSIAIEPMNCNVDAFNNQEGLMDLEKESRYRASFNIKLIDHEEYSDILEDFD